MENQGNESYQERKELTILNLKELSLERKYAELYKKELKGSLIAMIKGKDLKKKINEIGALLAYEEQSRLFEALENTEYEPFITSFMQEFSQNSYKENINVQRLTNVSTNLASMKSATLDFYETLNESKIIEKSQTILREKNFGEYITAFAHFKSGKMYYNYLEGTSSFIMKPTNTIYDYWIYQWLNAKCCVHNIAAQDVSISNQVFLGTVPAFLNLIYIDYLAKKLSADEECTTIKKMYHQQVAKTIAFSEWLQEIFNCAINDTSSDFKSAKDIGIALVSEWAHLFTAFVGYSLFRVWQEDPRAAMQMLDAYMNKFSQISKTLDLSLIGISNQDVLKYTRDFGKYGK